MRFFSFIYKRNVVNDVVQGIIVGGVLGFVTLTILAHAYVSHVNNWTTMLGCGEPGDTIIFRAACTFTFRGPINVSQEAMYWTTSKDGSGQNLSGKNDYILRFPAGQLPPNEAFWSITMGDTKNHFVPNPINRYSVSNRSDLGQNQDGSVDIYIQHAVPAGRESNWLPAPTGSFVLWLRVYRPTQEILSGKYKVPPIMEVK